MDLEAIVERYHAAADEFSRGNPEPVKALYSHRDDATLANPFGPPVQGWPAVSAGLDFASSNFRDGRVNGFERVACHLGVDLASLLELEHWEAKVGDRQEISPFDLRVTTLFRVEAGSWRIAHRHADPITTSDPDGPLRSL